MESAPVHARPWPLFVRFAGATKLAFLRRVWKLDIGRGTRVHPSALLDRTWPTGLHIGANCSIEANAVILTHDYTRGILTDTYVGDRCHIGERAIILPGVRIGNGCRVMPGAVVTRSLPDGVEAIGNPAEFKDAGPAKS